MNFTLLDQILWAAGFIESAVLLLVLLVHKRWKSFPFFSAWIAFNTVRTVLLFFVYRHGSDHTYALVYWSASYFDLALQLGLVYEITRNVLKPAEQWVHDARKMFLSLAIVGTAIAVIIAYFIKPTSTSQVAFWIEKGNLFSSMLIVELVVSMMFASSHLGLVRNSHIMQIGEGLAIWAAVALLSEAAYSHFGPNWHGAVLDKIRILTYQCATIYWIISLWRPEPERRTLSPDMQAYLDNLHKQLQSELSSIENTKKR